MVSKKHFFNLVDADYINVRFGCTYCQAEVSSGYLSIHKQRLRGSYGLPRFSKKKMGYGNFYIVTQIP